MAAVQELRRSEILKVTVVSNDFNRGACAFELGSPLLEAADDRQELLVVDLVVTLRRGMFLGEECNRSQDAVVSILRQDASGDIIGGVGFQDNLLFPVKRGQDGYRGEGLF